MQAEQQAAVVRKLNELGERIEARKRAFKARGEFPDEHERLVRMLESEQAAIRARITDKLKDGVSWDLIETEFERDLDGLHGELLRWERRLDAAAMAGKGR